MKRVHLSLGSNLGDRRQNLEAAIAHLEQSRIHVLRRSPIYETEPQDVRSQPWFLNLVVEAETALFPVQLLKQTQRIEQELGRQRTGPAKGPRLIDIDILLYAQFQIQTPSLQIPHPRMLDRRFVLQPLADLVPDLRHPQSRRTIKEHLSALKGQTIRPALPQ